MSQESGTTQSRRAAILVSAGLAESPRAVQQFFWRRYNYDRARRRMPAVLGDLAVAASPESATMKDHACRRIEAAWQRVLPAEYADAARVEGFRSGRLQIVADSAATRYVLERQLGAVLLDAINAELGSSEVSRIEFRLGRQTGERKKTSGKRMRQRGTKA